MKKIFSKSMYIAIAITIVLFAVMGTVSLSSINVLQGQARVVNYVGIVRGATQKLVKEELMGHPDDALLQRLDGIVNELLTGEGTEDLIVLQDEVYLENMRQVQASWNSLKEDIARVRQGEGEQELYDASQAYFDLVNETVFSAEEYSEGQVGRINAIMIAVNGAFVLLIVVGLVFAVRSSAVRKRAEALEKTAYVDPLTSIENRASCERCIDLMTKVPPEGEVSVFIFDMNDLKLTNDSLGHQGGDKVIAAFASILSRAAEPYGFMGRYGGDEFLAIFKEVSEEKAQEFLKTIHEEVEAFNAAQPSRLEQIHYAAGYARGSLAETDMEELIHTADNQMYVDKRKTKEASGSTTGIR